MPELLARPPGKSNQYTHTSKKEKRRPTSRVLERARLTSRLILAGWTERYSILHLSFYWMSRFFRNCSTLHLSLSWLSARRDASRILNSTEINRILDSTQIRCAGQSYSYCRVRMRRSASIDTTREPGRGLTHTSGISIQLYTSSY